MANTKNVNPEIQALYSELIEHMKGGVEMHEQLADYYGFLNLPGYQKCHEYHMLCELLAYRKAKHEYMKEYHQLVPPMDMAGLSTGMTNMSNNRNNNGNNNRDNNPNGRMGMPMPQRPQVINPTWYNYTRYDVDAGTKRTAVKDGFKMWMDWEKGTKEFLTEMLHKLQENGEHQFKRKIEFLLDEVEKEIAQGEEKMISLENAGYDMNYILQQQDELKKKYARKIETLNMKDYHYRPAGIGNYATYNFHEEDDYDDYCYEDFARGGRGRARDSRGRFI